MKVASVVLHVGDKVRLLYGCIPGVMMGIQGDLATVHFITGQNYTIKLKFLVKLK